MTHFRSKLILTHKNESFQCSAPNRNNLALFKMCSGYSNQLPFHNRYHFNEYISIERTNYYSRLIKHPSIFRNESPASFPLSILCRSNRNRHGLKKGQTAIQFHINFITKIIRNGYLHCIYCQRFIV